MKIIFSVNATVKSNVQKISMLLISQSNSTFLLKNSHIVKIKLMAKVNTRVTIGHKGVSMEKYQPPILQI